jgi:hypothetical protein
MFTFVNKLQAKIKSFKLWHRRIIIIKVKVSRYTPWRRMGGEEV